MRIVLASFFLLSIPSAFSETFPQLNRALESHQSERVREHIEKGADPNGAILNIRTFAPSKIPLLEYAVRHSTNDVCMALIRGGATVDDSGLLPIAAKRPGLLEVIQALLKADLEPDNLFIYQLAGSGYWQVLKQLKDADENLNQVGHNGQTPLHRASYRRDNARTISLLLDAGLDVNAADDFGYTPLMYAAMRQNNRNDAAILIKHGADIHRVTKKATTALHFARGRELTELLITSGADINAKDDQGNTPLDAAYFDSRFKYDRRFCADVLREHRALTRYDHDAEDLKNAVSHRIEETKTNFPTGDLELIKTLLKKGVTPQVHIQRPPGGQKYDSVLLYSLWHSTDEACVTLIENENKLEDHNTLFWATMLTGKRANFDRATVVDALRKNGAVYAPTPWMDTQKVHHPWGYLDKGGQWHWTYQKP